MNLVILKGNLGKDPEIKQFEWGKVAKFSLATTESYKNKQGEKVTEVEWHNLVFKGAVCEAIEKYLHKGDQIAITGKIKTRQYKDNSGNNHYATEVICDSFEFCGSTKEKPNPENNEGKSVKGKVDMKSLSDINELPGANDDNDLSNLPF